MTTFQIHRLPAFQDNYLWALEDSTTQRALVVDPGDAEVIQRWLDTSGASLDAILVTHHHPDHIGGVEALKERHACRVFGPAYESRLNGLLTDSLVQGDQLPLDYFPAKVLEVPGHTSSHVAYWSESHKALFCGDTLFVLGCGRMFEGSPEQFWASLEQLRTLPDDTQVYCAHEYSLSNAKFALSVDPDNEQLRVIAADIQQARAAGLSTVPSVLGQEKLANPFLRADVLGPRLYPHLQGANPANWFAEIRKAKDEFRT
jgi:hydroxyacylglutathione hydrolase